LNELFCRSCLSLCPLSVGEGSSDDGYEREREREREREMSIRQRCNNKRLNRRKTKAGRPVVPILTGACVLSLIWLRLPWPGMVLHKSYTFRFIL
jgi:hypothetical protein